MKKHRNYKLTPRQLKNIQKYYEELGWKVEWLSVYFRLHRDSIVFHIRKRGWVRKRKVPELMPEKVAVIYRRKEKVRYLDTTYRDTKEKKKKLVEGSYEYIRNLAEQQRHKNCQHVRWIKRCSFCAKILESDSINNQQIKTI